MEGVYTEFYSCGVIPSMSGHMSVYSAYTRRMKGYTEGGVHGMCTDFVYLMDNGSGFWLRPNLFSGFLVAGFMGIQILASKLIRKQTLFTCVSLCCLFNICKLKSS